MGASEPVWTLWRRWKHLAAEGNRTPTPRSSSVLVIPTSVISALRSYLPVRESNPGAPLAGTIFPCQLRATASYLSTFSIHKGATPAHSAAQRSATTAPLQYITYMSFPAKFMARLVPINCGNAKSSVTSSHPKVTHCTTSERDRDRE
jgi:hypothetical protein